MGKSSAMARTSWITLLAYLMDLALATFARRAFPWAYAGERR